MPNLDEVLLNLITDVLPSGIQAILLFIALMGMVIIGSAILDLYTVLQHDFRQFQSGQRRPATMLVRAMIGGLMTVPAVVLWRVADGLMGGGKYTETALLSYSGGFAGQPYCDQFSAGVTMVFMAAGGVAMFVGFQAMDDQARGFNQTGARSGLLYLIGGVGCFFILDIIEMLSNTTGFELGFEHLCTVIG